MLAIYFAVFCIGIGYVIFWSLRYDDQADFTGQKRDKKFKPSQKLEDEDVSSNP